MFEEQTSGKMAKIHELHFALLPHSPYLSDFAPSDFYLFVDCKEIFAGNIFGSNKEVITETEAYFAVKDKSFSKKGIEVTEHTVVNLIRYMML